MSAKTKKKKGPLKVRRYLWQVMVKDLITGPKTEVMRDGEWIPIQDLDVARSYAREHGYVGISIEMC